MKNKRTILFVTAFLSVLAILGAEQPVQKASGFRFSALSGVETVFESELETEFSGADIQLQMMRFEAGFSFERVVETGRVAFAPVIGLASVELEYGKNLGTWTLNPAFSYGADFSFRRFWLEKTDVSFAAKYRRADFTGDDFEYNLRQNTGLFAEEELRSTQYNVAVNLHQLFYASYDHHYAVSGLLGIRYQDRTLEMSRGWFVDEKEKMESKKNAGLNLGLNIKNRMVANRPTETEILLHLLDEVSIGVSVSASF